MLRYVIASGLVLLLAAPAAAVVVENNAADPDINITLTVGCYTNVWWNNTTDDHQIVYGANDYYRAKGLPGDHRGAYDMPPPPKPAGDAYADGYYESQDHAFFWLEANCNVDWTVITSGNMASTDDELPSWFTIAFTNNMGGGGGFINDDTRQTCGTIPLDGEGTYAQDSNDDGTMTLFDCTDDDGNSAFYPNQWPFPMADGAGAGRTYGTVSPSFAPYAEGTILFHSRIERSALHDEGGVYTATINMTYSESTP